MREQHARTGDPGQVLEVLRDVLVENMNDDDGLPHYQIQSAVILGKHSGRMLSPDDVMAGRDVPGGLMLTMRDGAEYRLTLDWAGG